MPTILVADDDENVLDLLLEILENAGFQVVAARNGVEALERFSAVGADAVITDMRMPRLDGLGVLTAVKRDQLAREGRTLGPDEEASIRDPILEKYEREGSPYYSTARLWDDGILDPAETRAALALGLSAAFNAPIAEARFGVFRM